MIQYDPIEDTEEYKKAMKEIQPILDKAFPEKYIGICHSIWFLQKSLLEKKGIEWKTPVEMNPGVLFD